MAKKMDVMGWVVFIVGIIYLLSDLKVVNLTYGINIFTAAYLLWGIHLVMKR